MSDEVINEQTAHIEQSTQSNDSAPADVPLSAPEAPADIVTPPSVKDDNSIPAQQEIQPDEPVQTEPTAQTEPEPTPAPAPATSPQTGTVQTVVNEPLGELLEPNVPAPTPTPISAEPISQPKSLARQLIAKAREAIQNRKRKKIDRILDLFASRTNITNSQVADFLHVSDATATRYLQVLENKK